MRRAGLLLSLVLLSACVAETVERRRPRKGPVAEVGYVDYGGGNVRYSLEGWDWFVAGRKRAALRLMRHNCGRDLEPHVVDEYSREDADAAFAGEDVAASLAHGGEHFRVERYMHQTYECWPKGQGARPVAASSSTAVSVSTSSIPLPGASQ